MEDLVELSDAEWLIMNLVWDRQPLVAHEIIAELKDPQSWSPATIRTMLHRLIKKGALDYQPEGNRYLYRAAVRKTDCIRRAAKSFLDRVFDGEAAPLLAHFVRNSKFTPEEIAQLKRLLNEKEK